MTFARRIALGEGQIRMVFKRLDAPLSPAIEHLLEKHQREVDRLRVEYSDADPAEVLARFVRDTFPLDALMQVRDGLGADGALFVDLGEKFVDLDHEQHVIVTRGNGRINGAFPPTGARESPLAESARRWSAPPRGHVRP